MSHAIETRGLSYRAGRTFEIRDLNLRIPQGSIYGFLGANGSGKTTTMHLVLGLLRADRGTIEVLGREIPKDVAEVNARTGFVPERAHLYRSLTIDELTRYESAFYPAWDGGRADELIDAFGLERERRVGRLSKGETGQLIVLLALARSPELLVLDEPTDGLDPVVRRDILAALLEYVSGNEATVFISSHLVHELERVCDWVGVIDDGRMVAELPMQVFKEGIKRLRVRDAPEEIADPPFEILDRQRGDGLSDTEVWVVRGWETPMKGYFGGIGASLRETIDLDLEEGFVELLRTARTTSRKEVS